MAYCQECGAEISDGVNFCKHCGARQGYLAEAPKGIGVSEFFADDESNVGEECADAETFFDDGVPDVEDGEVDCEKGLDPNRSYVMRFGGRSAELYNDWGQLIRRFNMRTNVIQATTTGETVAIVTDDGWTHLYRWDGQLIRRFH